MEDLVEEVFHKLFGDVQTHNVLPVSQILTSASSDQEIDCADIGISTPSAKLI